MSSTIKPSVAKRMTAAQKRVAIAKDVLKQLETKFIRAKRMVYCCIRTKSRKAKYDGEAQVRDFLSKEVSQCQVCAMGSLFVAIAKRFDGITVEKASGGYRRTVQTNMFYEDDYWRWLIEKFFSYKQLDLIESEFEGTRDFSTSNSSARAKLKEIMQNIIRNRGTFVVDPKGIQLVAVTNKLTGILDVDPYGCHVCGAKRPVDWDDDSDEPLKHLPGCDLEAARLVVEKARQ